MVVMSFMLENLAPVARGVNRIVHQMHGSDVTLQIISHIILHAAITIMQVMQQNCITHSVGLAGSGGGHLRCERRGRDGRHHRNGGLKDLAVD